MKLQKKPEQPPLDLANMTAQVVIIMQRLRELGFVAKGEKA